MSEVPLGSVAEVVMGQSPPGSTYNNDRRGLPLLNGPTEFGPDHPAVTLFTTNPAKVCRPHDLLFCVRGSTTGRMNWADQTYALGRGVCAIRGETRLDTRFIYYALRDSLPSLLQRAGGSTFPNLSRNDLLTFPIPWPAHRQRIASILGAYDDLIEVNRRRIAVLEEMARRLFEEWFVHFRFPGHDVGAAATGVECFLPKGWQRLGLHDVAEVAFGFPFKSARFNTEGRGTRVVRIRDVPAGETATFTDEPFDPRYSVKDGDLLVGMDGIFHTAIWAGGDAALNQRVARLRPRDGRSTMWLLLSVLPKVKRLEATITGTTVAHLSARDLKVMSLIVPPSEIQRRADGLLRPIGDAIVAHRHEQRRLAASRDLLLPRLISGELSFAAAERELEAAA